jgi:predicted outer membrane repeat protein
VTFDPSLAGQTISLDGTLWVWPKEITIDGADAPGIVVSGGGFDRIFIIQPGANATIRNLVVTEGYGWQVAGGILNNGALTLDHVTVTGSFVATEAGQFWQGGGGIYNGDGSSLNLIDSNVSSNTSGGDGGGIYSFFNTTTNVVRSAINANMANNVGGGLRILGNGEIVNSTFSGNIATSWYGGAIFITDGVVNLLNTTVVDNSSAPWAPGDIFVGTFTDAGATLTLTNSIVSSAGDNCMFGIFGPGAVTLSADHNNVFTDFSCSAGASDQVVGDPGLEPLADNGGPTFTHALLAGSYAIDAADEAVCPDTDQRGVSRPQGTGCDVGSFERVP